jgi:hypothetical protein
MFPHGHAHFAMPIIMSLKRTSAVTAAAHALWSLLAESRHDNWQGK